MTLDTLSASPPIRKPLALRNLQPRAAAAVNFADDFSDDDDLDEFGGHGSSYLSSDYKAQRRTTQELVDFFKSAPPPSPPRDLMPIAEEKKKTLLQRLRSRKLSASMGAVGGRLGLPGTNSSISGMSDTTGGSSASGTATLPNGKKYVMIAVDYDGKDGKPPKPSGSDSGDSLLSNNPSIQVTSSAKDKGVSGSGVVHYAHQGTGTGRGDTASLGGDQRRSIIIQAGGGEGSSFILDSSPFLLDNFALDADYIMTGANPDTIDGQLGHRRTGSSKSGQSQGADSIGGEDMRRGGSKRGNKVKFNMPGDMPSAVVLDDDALTKALNDRMANHRAQLAQHPEMATGTGDSGPGGDKEEIPPEVVLPKPVARKRVRHVQIQTQHCVMRPMYTQTEPLESMAHDLEVKEFSCQTDSDDASSTVASTATMTTNMTSSSTTARSKAAHLMTKPIYITSTSTTSISTSTSTVTSPTTPRGAEAGSLAMYNGSSLPPTTLPANEAEELIMLRQQNATLQTQVAHLKRDLASEIRARTRTAVAMQDTRDKFEMLSAMAYKKLKEMIFQRHILEMESRELRVKVDMLTEEGDLYNPHQQQVVHHGHHSQQHTGHQHYPHHHHHSNGHHNGHHHGKAEYVS
ncbi:hypothetical protein EMPS_03583 [Entomortierella parvispora]|uniref:Uncharacterized protein n=1 Tax=Entomortierella parvispora TaxID=205924 RepID=A0A9P3H7I7_9FUNG|nr:hypothetical protein EMPS_03583 [Entomortierella parvispora]